MGKRSIDSLAEYARSPLNIIIGLRFIGPSLEQSFQLVD